MPKIAINSPLHDRRTQPGDDARLARVRAVLGLAPLLLAMLVLMGYVLPCRRESEYRADAIAVRLTSVSGR